MTNKEREVIFDKLLNNYNLSIIDLIKLRTAVDLCSDVRPRCLECPLSLGEQYTDDTIDCGTIIAMFAKRNINTITKMIAQRNLAQRKREKSMLVQSYTDSQGRIRYRCSNCGEPVIALDYTSYCHACGQKIKFKG